MNFRVSQTKRQEKKSKKILALLVVFWFNQCMENLSNKELKMLDKEKKDMEMKIALWDLVSKIDNDVLQHHLRNAILDNLDMAFNNGIDRGFDIASQSIKNTKKEWGVK